MKGRHIIVICILLSIAGTGWASAAVEDPGAQAAMTLSGAEEPLIAETVTTVVPGVGELLVYHKDTWHPVPYTELAAAAGLNLEEEHNELPEDLDTYECVVLSLNTALPEADLQALASYVQTGGNLVAIGEWAAVQPSPNPVMNEVAQAAGSGLRLVTGAVDLGAHNTDQVPPSTLTLGVTSVRYAAASTITGADGLTAPAVVQAQDGEVIMAAEQVGLGVLVVAGDVNILSDWNNGGYAEEDNAMLGSNVCNGLVALGLPGL